ncbi:MAG: DUF4230 domain-containing protein [Clostridia bacterium]|nr:DUF4230 domain-containing protein [Clostridia bacterium]
MKKFFQWLLKLIGSALTMVIVLALLPHASRLMASLMPDESGAAIRASAVIARKLETTARLETLAVSEEGVLNYDINAAFIGTVASVNVKYQYNASFGIDLKSVRMQVSGSRIIFSLPEPILLNDSLTPIEVYRNDDWYPYFDDNDYQKLLEDERIACRERYLSGEYAQQLWDAATTAMDETVGRWIADVDGRVSIQYVMAEQDAP